MKIIACGGYLPEKIVTNFDLAENLNTTDEWIYSRVGIKQRHIAAEGEYTSDLATKAVQDACRAGNIDMTSIDGIIIATTTPDKIFPSTACLTQSKLSIANAFAFDISAVCGGFVYGLICANALISTGAAKRIAVIGAETMSRVVDWNDRTTCVLFGDGAGCFIVEKSDGQSAMLASNWHSNGDLAEILCVPGGISTGNHLAKIYMNGREVYKNAVEKMGSSIVKVIADAGLQVSDVDLIVPHQANQRITDSIAARLDVDASKMVSTIELHANTSGATIPLAFKEAVKEGRVHRGQNIVFTALGAGLVWGAVLVRY